jgi:CRP-like cAMP-binding protein
MRTTLPPRQALLAQVRLFRSCRAEELDRLAAATTELEVSPAEVLCQEGQAGHEFFLVVEGQARVTMSEREIATLGPGSFFGEMALLDGGPRIATVTAATSMKLLVLHRREFRHFLGRRPAVVTEVVSVVGERMRSIQRRLAPASNPAGL